MTASAVLKMVKKAYPEAFEKLSKPKLRLIEEAVLYASRLSDSGDVLEEREHQATLTNLTGNERLSPGQKLKAYRLREGLSQIDLAKDCGIPQANLSAMEAGRRSIGTQTAKRLAKALGCDFRQLV